MTATIPKGCGAAIPLGRGLVTPPAHAVPRLRCNDELDFRPSSVRFPSNERQFSGGSSGPLGSRTVKRSAGSNGGTALDASRSRIGDRCSLSSGRSARPHQCRRPASSCRLHGLEPTPATTGLEGQRTPVNVVQATPQPRMPTFGERRCQSIPDTAPVTAGPSLELAQPTPRGHSTGLSS